MKKKQQQHIHIKILSKIVRHIQTYENLKKKKKNTNKIK